MQDRVFGDLSKVQTNEFDSLPPGDYAMRAVSMEMKATQTSGERLAVQFEVMDGNYQGQKHFDGFNLVNANPQAVQIALGDIKSWMLAVGLIQEAEQQLTMSNILKLEGKPVVLRLKKRKQGSGVDIGKFISYGANTGGQQTLQQPAPQQPSFQPPRQQQYQQPTQQPAHQPVQPGQQSGQMPPVQQAPVQTQPVGGQIQQAVPQNVGGMPPAGAAPQMPPAGAAPAPWQQQ